MNSKIVDSDKSQQVRIRLHVHYFNIFSKTSLKRRVLTSQIFKMKTFSTIYYRRQFNVNSKSQATESPESIVFRMTRGCPSSMMKSAWGFTDKTSKPKIKKVYTSMKMRWICLLNLKKLVIVRKITMKSSEMSFNILVWRFISVIIGLASIYTTPV